VKGNNILKVINDNFANQLIDEKVNYTYEHVNLNGESQKIYVFYMKEEKLQSVLKKCKFSLNKDYYFDTKLRF